jgi:2-amino-4-hydroxy-6-hydroxymethyldihydropteridine diphosphokinase
MTCSESSCLISFGSNLGASPRLFAEVMNALQTRQVEVIQRSSLLQTQPVGINAGGGFLNAVMAARWSGSALELLAVLQATEEEFGRQRTIRWGPRTLDLDLLLLEDTICATSQLLLPHPAMWYRGFVLGPAAEIAPDLQHPLLGVSLGELWEQLRVRPLPLAIDDRYLTGSDRGEFLSALPHVPEVEWTDAFNSAAFAVISPGLATDQQPALSYPVHSPTDRRIPIFISTAAEGVQQVQQLLIAMTG